MKPLAVFDLDGTLIPGDSFGHLVRAQLATTPSLALRAIARRLSLISRSSFAESAHRSLVRQFSDRDALAQIVEDIAKAIDRERFAKVEEWQSRGAATLLLSASPGDYVVPLGQRLGFDFAAGSWWRDGKYNQLYGEAKCVYLNEYFPASDWQRAYAMADAESDRPLLAVFEHAHRVKPLLEG